MWARDEWRRAILKAMLMGFGILRLTVIVDRAILPVRATNLVDLDVISLMLYLAILAWLTGWTQQADRDRKHELDAEIHLSEC